MLLANIWLLWASSHQDTVLVATVQTTLQPRTVVPKAFSWARLGDITGSDGVQVPALNLDKEVVWRVQGPGRVFIFITLLQRTQRAPEHRASHAPAPGGLQRPHL